MGFSRSLYMQCLNDALREMRFGTKDEFLDLGRLGDMLAAPEKGMWNYQYYRALSLGEAGFSKPVKLGHWERLASVIASLLVCSFVYRHRYWTDFLMDSNFSVMISSVLSEAGVFLRGGREADVGSLCAYLRSLLTKGLPFSEYQAAFGGKEYPVNVEDLYRYYAQLYCYDVNCYLAMPVHVHPFVLRSVLTVLYQDRGYMPDFLYFSPERENFRLTPRGLYELTDITDTLYEGLLKGI